MWLYVESHDEQGVYGLMYTEHGDCSAMLNRAVVVMCSINRVVILIDSRNRVVVVM